ncbi:MAG: hypothetical protein WC741_03540 [Patescibacteria group bacterium]|jgi:hypothetical protein
MPIYSTLQEALLAGQLATRDYKANVSDRTKIEAKFVQKKDSEFKPVVKDTTAVVEQEDPIKPDLTENPPPDPVPEPEPDPRDDLEQLIRDLHDQRDTVPIDKNAPQPDDELFEDPPSLVIGAAIVKIDTSRKHRQQIEGAEQVQQTISEQNLSSKMVEPFAKSAAKTRTFGGKVIKQGAANLASMIRHPVSTVQNMFFREPIEQREIAFASEINRRIKAYLFPNSPEIPLTIPEEFIKKALQEGRAKRNATKGKQLIHALADSNPLTTVGMTYDSQQRRALDWVAEQLAKRPEDWPPEIKRIKKESIKYLSDLAQRFSITVNNGDEPAANQNRFNSQILLEDEHRTQVDNDIVKTEVKSLLHDFVFRDAPPTEEEMINLINSCNDIYLTAGLITKDDIRKGEIANNILPALDELTLDPHRRDFYRRNWDKLKIIAYTGDSHGDNLGGAKKFTKNQEVALKYQDKKDAKTLAQAGIYAGAITAVDTIGYLAPYLVALRISSVKSIPRAITGAVTHALPILGPIWSGLYGGTIEAVDIAVGKHLIRESRTTAQLRQVSRDKALLKPSADVDFTRADFEKSLVTAIPATELTSAINELILENPNDWKSETKKNLSEEHIKQLVAHVAHAKARLDLTMRSGSKELNFKTQNWISYHEGHDQEELTKLKAATVQAFARLMVLHSENPNLFNNVPFGAVNHGVLEDIINSSSTIIRAGLMEGIPSSLFDGTVQLSNVKSQKFYKQIFKASGIPEDQTDQVISFLNSIKTSTKIQNKTIAEWLKESESLKSRAKELKELKVRRFFLTGSTAALTSLAFTGIKHAADTSVQALQQHFTPIDTGSHEVPSSISVETVNTIIPWDHIFAKDGPGNQQNISMWIEGKLQSVPIKFAHDVQVVFDKDGNIDLKDSNGDVLDNFLVRDQSHQGGYVFNSHFRLNDQSAEIDLTKIMTTTIEHKTDQVDNGSFNLWQKAEDFRMVWGHSGHIRPDHDYIFETKDIEHPYGVEIRFVDDTIRNPNDNVITTLLDHFNNKSMAAVFEIKGLLGGKDGHILVKDCIEKIDDGKGGYYFSLKLDPTSDKIVTLADGTTTTMGQIAQAILNEKDLVNHQNLGYPDSSEMSIKTMDVFNLANNGRTGYIYMGFITEATGPHGGQLFGHSAIPGGDKQIFIPVHMASGTGDLNNDVQIANPTAEVDIINGIINQKDILIPGVPPLPKEAPTSIIEHEPIKYTPLPGVYNSPQLSPTEPPSPATPSSTPLPNSIINQIEFKKEERQARVDNLEAKEFIDRLVAQNLPVDQKVPKIDDFIISRYFTASQQKFLRDKRHLDFIGGDICSVVGVQKPELLKKMLRNNPQKLTPADKQDLKQIVSQVAKDNNYTEKDALIMSEFMIQQSFYDNLFWAVTELKDINAKLEEATAQLSSLPRSDARPLRPQVDTEPPIRHKMTDEEFIVEFFNKQEAEVKDSTEDGEKEISSLFNRFVISKLIPKEQEFFEDEVFINNFINYHQTLLQDHQELMKKIYSVKPLTTEDKEELKQVIIKIDNGPSYNQKIAIFDYFVATNNTTVILNKEAEKRENWNQIEIETMDVDSTIGYDQNRKAADQFIAILRDPKRLKTSPSWPENYLVHDYGFVFDRNNGGTVSNPELIESRYHLPFATYSNHLIPSVSHANLVIRGPRLDPLDNLWKIIIYDPYQFNIREETLKDVHNQEGALKQIHGNKIWEKDYFEGNDDIYFDDLELRPYLDALVSAKLPPFQQDMINCYPYCFFVATMLNALKPGKTEFKTQGIPQFFKDYQLNILDRDEVLRRLKKS